MVAATHCLQLRQTISRELPRQYQRFWYRYTSTLQALHFIRNKFCSIPISRRDITTRTYLFLLLEHYALTTGHQHLVPAITINTRTRRYNSNR